jgi:hypothetical protein
VQAQDRQTRREIRRGEIVRVNPENSTIVLRSGAGAEAKEFEYRVGPTTKYWGKDRKILNEGLRYNGWRAGTSIWYIPGESEAVSELWLADPNMQIANRTPAYLEGTVVRVDPVTNSVVVKTRVGTEVKEFEYRVDPNTRYWGTDNQPFTTALNYQGFREGTPVWFHVGPGERSRILNEVRFHNPTAKVIRP